MGKSNVTAQLSSNLHSHSESRPDDSSSQLHDDSRSVSSASGGSASGGSLSSSGLTSGNSSTTDLKSDGGLEGSESKALSWAKVFVVFVLLSLAAIVSYFWWKIRTEKEEEAYEVAFTMSAGRIIQIFFERLDYKVTAANSFAVSLASLSSNAYNISSGGGWPFVSFDNFERRSAASRRLADATSCWISPFLTKGMRSDWETYATENQNYLKSNFVDPYVGRSLETINYVPPITSSPYKQVDWSTEKGLYLIADDDTAEAVPNTSSNTYHAPIWQSAPSSITHTTAMFDQASERMRKQTLDNVYQSKTSFFSPSQFSGKEYSSSLVNEYENGPHVFLYTPIFDTRNSTKNTVVASLTMDMEWASFWAGVNAGMGGSFTFLLESSCDDDKVFSFSFDGNSVEYLGTGDSSVYANKVGLEMSSTYQDFNQVMGYNEDILLASASADVCSYKIAIFPNEDFEAFYLTTAPMNTAIGFAAIFVVTAMLFLCYDAVVERRQRGVLESVNRSNAIVKSLFPTAIRKRLLAEGKANRDTLKGLEGLLPKDYNIMTTDKSRLKSFLTNDAAGGGQSGGDRGTMAANLVGSEPIAEFFPATTVLFADLAGFTAWSSTREPSQVFTLLETLYGAMDKAAKKFAVFKVETVGDCYVAATGIPDQRDDHAVIMVRFAISSLDKVRKLTAGLESELGPGTADLSMRYGIHSGPVTAGVLRGEKSRFQLFGDTMTNAARMEHTGLKNRIQISKETADLLTKANKSRWIESRSQKDSDGFLNGETFWVLTHSHHPKTRSIASVDLTDGEGSLGGEDDDARSRSSLDAMVCVTSSHERLVDYNVEVLIKLLKKIVARRSVVEDEVVMSDLDRSSTGGKIPLNEVKEVVEMPEFNAEAAVKMQSDSAVEIPTEVRAQLYDYILRIARSYNSNPFHNFEHASHVALSANKLLKRIVMPDDIDYRRDGAKKKIEKFLAVAEDLHKHTLGISSDPVTQFAVVFSALIHDAGHPGVPNFVLAEEEPETAEKYDSKSIAEQRSIDIAWDVLMEDKYNKLRKYMFPTNREFKHFRQLIVNSVVATDIFDKEQSAMRKARWQKCFHPEESFLQELESKNDAFNRKATIVIEHIIQASDVAHTMQHWQVYKKWNERLFMEMYTAYKEGRQQKDPSEGWYNGEIWFFDNYIIPLANKLKECGVFGVSSAEYLNYAMENRDEWQRKGEEIVAKMLQQATMEGK